jgi:hypothetical protein
MDSVNDNPCVYSWGRSDPKFKQEYNSFNEYLTDVFQVVIDNIQKIAGNDLKRGKWLDK